jgi:hypothetical protein
MYGLLVVLTKVPLPGVNPTGPYSKIAVPVAALVKLIDAVVDVSGVALKAVGGGHGGAFFTEKSSMAMSAKVAGVVDKVRALKRMRTV